jgi:hypothetical protein
MKRTLRSPRLASAVLALCCTALLAACASTSPTMDAKFGDAVRQARLQQTLNPNASANRNPVLGIDGRAGASAQDRYQESFRTPPRTFEIINIGGAITGQ